ncbi:uncharacterized protein Z519_08661 [Cladophialophora bantiana CBS 173.52]|uniref:AAA+ ATPase domain-containing protein n=1 Tax=Cladophialophora bantiana (strain ATCC 10958 / CBS 173.52 / CDC B-1940 / NIH 8579) TaxID=1442370 RepID=A0A0D2HC61_CLAB1|nr:uncharacterized protein Z519_08661 [Cladophialophora bantiana CBS 173.52]KIW90878.1 hypothetical protein Z519_08661 [Cladophialophora bantiana CBS 173.52]
MPSIDDFVYGGLERGESSDSLDEVGSTIKEPVIVVDEVSADGEYEPDPAADIFEAGMKCESKRLYPRHDGSLYVEWVDEIPARIMDQACGYGNAWKEYALLLRTNLEQGEQRIQSILIQSPLLKSKLNSIFQDYPGFFMDENKATIDAPFKPFVHCWDAFEGACQDQSQIGKHMQLLRSALEPELQEAFAVIKDFQTHGMIRFDRLWMIFKPGSFIFSEHQGIERIYKLRRTELRKTPETSSVYFLLHCYSIDWDGKAFGHTLEVEGIKDFEGSRKFTDLGVFPLDSHPAKGAVIERLVERGRKFSSYTRVHYRAYNGPATSYVLGGAFAEEQVSGRVVVDTETFMHFHPYSRDLIQRLGTNEPKGKDSNEDSDQIDSSYTNRNMYINIPHLRDQAILSANNKSLEMEQTELTDDQLMICCPTVRGYSLDLNVWMHLRIDYLRKIQWNANAFESLALPGNYKRLLLAFAETQRDSAAQFDDVIEGKGKGMVVLLEGPPGLGKTLTASSVAEKMKVPIFKIASGQMKSDPGTIKAALQDAFLMTKSWKGIILLDEADIFLERRSVNDLDRNQLVSVFLQHLEYFEGTIFLTTNRVECIDPAFESRIHLSLSYPELTQELRHKIWKNFIQRMKVDTTQITDAHLDKFAALDLNGRQIKNTVKMAGLLAAQAADHCLTAEHVETMLTIVQSK